MLMYINTIINSFFLSGDAAADKPPPEKVILLFYHLLDLVNFNYSFIMGKANSPEVKLGTVLSLQLMRQFPERSKK